MSDLFEFHSPPTLYAVMGNPVAHSKSPQIHSAFARQCGLRIDYRAIQVDRGGFAQAVANFRAADGQGLNVTVPFKVEAWRLAARCSERAQLAEAVNTLSWDDDGLLLGDNTDGAGLVTDLLENLNCQLGRRRVLLIGAGGAARGVLGPLLAAGPERVLIANRTADNAVALADRFGHLGEVLGCGFEAVAGAGFDVVINASAASLAGDLPPLAADVVAEAALVYDMAYGDEPTVFMAWARAQGAAVVSDGLGMLVEQAAESFLLWHGVRPETAPVLRSLRSA